MIDVPVAVQERPLRWLRDADPIDAWVWHEPDMLTALAARDIRTVLKRLGQYGMTQRQIAQRTSRKQSEVERGHQGAAGGDVLRGAVRHRRRARHPPRLPRPGLHRPARRPGRDGGRPGRFGRSAAARGHGADGHGPAMRTVRLRGTAGGVLDGREIRALYGAMRMSTRTFARYLGVSDRSVSKWTSVTGPLVPRPVNQSALDTAYARLDEEAQRRFAAIPRWDADRGRAGDMGPGDEVPGPAGPTGAAELRAGLGGCTSAMNSRSTRGPVEAGPYGAARRTRAHRSAGTRMVA